MPVADVKELLDIGPKDGRWTVPAMTREFRKKREIVSPGEWIPLRAVGRSVARSLLPWFPGMTWMAEYDCAVSRVSEGLGVKGTEYVVRALRTELGVNLEQQVDRLGSLFVSWPEDRIDLKVSSDRWGTRVGGFIRLSSEFKLDELEIIVQAYLGDEVVSVQRCRPTHDNFHVEMGTPGDRFGVQVFHDDFGLVYLDDFIPMRTVSVAGLMTTGGTTLKVQPLNEEGHPVGEAQDIPCQLGMPADTEVGNVRSWERRRRNTRLRQERQALYDTGALRVFDGLPDCRRDAVAHIREIVGSHHRGPLRVWDEYLSGPELLMIVGALRRTGIPVRVLSGERRLPRTSRSRVTYAGLLPDDGGLDSPSIADVLRGLDRATETLGGRYQIWT